MKYPHLLKHKEAFIASMEILKDRYVAAMEQGYSKIKYERTQGQDCLLCNPKGIKESHHISDHSSPTDNLHKNKCLNLGCPWIVITGEVCDHESNQFHDGYRWTSVYNTDISTIQKHRIDQLEKWITIYKNHKEGELCKGKHAQ